MAAPRIIEAGTPGRNRDGSHTIAATLPGDPPQVAAANATEILFGRGRPRRGSGRSTPWLTNCKGAFRRLDLPPTQQKNAGQVRPAYDQITPHSRADENLRAHGT